MEPMSTQPSRAEHSGPENHRASGLLVRNQISRAHEDQAGTPHASYVVTQTPAPHGQGRLSLWPLVSEQPPQTKLWMPGAGDRDWAAGLESEVQWACSRREPGEPE